MVPCRATTYCTNRCPNRDHQKLQWTKMVISGERTTYFFKMCEKCRLKRICLLFFEKRITFSTTQSVQILHDSIVSVHQTYYIHDTSQHRFFSHPQNMEHQSESRYVWYEKTLPVMLSSRHLARWLIHTFTSRALESNISNTCAKHIEDRKVGARDLIAQNFELSRDFIYIGDLPDSPDSSVYSPSTNESDMDDFDYGALMDRNDQRAQVSQTQPSAHGSRSQMQKQSWQVHRTTK